MNQKLIIEKNFNLALENHQKNNLQIAERIYKFNQIPDLYTIIGLTLIIVGVLTVNLLGKVNS